MTSIGLLLGIHVSDVMVYGFTDEDLRFAGGVVTDIGYGHRIDSFDDEFFGVGERFIAHASAATTPSLLDLHPACTSSPCTILRTIADLGC